MGIVETLTGSSDGGNMFMPPEVKAMNKFYTKTTDAPNLTDMDETNTWMKHVFGEDSTNLWFDINDPFNMTKQGQERHKIESEIPDDVQITNVSASGAAEGVIDSLVGGSTINRNKKVWNKLLGTRALQIPLAAKYAKFKEEEE